MRLNLKDDSHLTVLELCVKQWAWALIASIGRKLDTNNTVLYGNSLSGYTEDEREYGAIVVELMKPIDSNFKLPEHEVEEIVPNGTRYDHFRAQAEKNRLIDIVMSMAELI